MKVKISTSPFGTVARTSVLLALSLLDESYPRELSRLLDLPLSGVQRALRSLESDGVIAARSAGRTRLFRLDPRYFARVELAALLVRLSEAEDGLRQRVEELRRRPRRTGKPL
ncbi:MAG: winged helix-turn-helix domain-containing protein [Phycisphaerales bacterium]|nr:winged helix-turn-helix domain-containing protein [Phycisphaerales bacterium]